MSQEHNSKLISDLYGSTDSQQALAIVDYMNDVLDGCFLYPIYDAYKKFGKDDYSFMFLSSISNINSSEVPKVLKEIGRDPKTEIIDFVQVLAYLRKYEIFDYDLISRAEEVLYRFYNKEKIFFALSDLFEYLHSAKVLEKNDSILRLIFEDDYFSKDDRQICLFYFFKVSPEKNISFYLENFSSIKDKKAESILTKEILRWTGPVSKKLLLKIKEEGGSYSKELISKKEKENNQKDKQQELKEESEYANAKLVNEIRNIRKKINTVSQTSGLFDFVLLPDNETLMDQLLLARDKNSLMVACISLRELLLDYSKEFKDHGMKLEEAQKYIEGVDTSTLNKPLNAIQLFLVTKGVHTDKDLFGLKSLNKLVSLIGAHQSDKELLEVLKRESLVELYSNEQWDLLHKKILSKYKVSLERFHDSIVKIQKPT